MAQPTLQNCFDGARSHLGDTQTAGGDVFTNTVLQDHFSTSWDELVGAMNNVTSPRIIRIFYWNLPAYTEEFSPQGNGIADFSEPEFLEERGSVVSVAITSTGITSPIQVTTSVPQGQTTGNEVIISGVSGTTAPWGRNFVTVIDPLNLTINGSITDGNAGTGGTLSTGTERFTEVAEADRVYDDTPISQLLTYRWEESKFKFRGATTARQLRITYVATGAAPTITSTVLGFDNCKAFLAARTAGLAAHAKGWYQMAQDLSTQALGPNLYADGSGGHLYTFLNNQVKLLQRHTTRRKPFRGQRYQNDTFTTF